MIFNIAPEEEMRATRRAAGRAGCVIRDLGIQDTNQGRRAVGHVDCPDGWAAARMLVAQAYEDARTPGARDIALALRRGAPDDASFARAIHAFVKANVRFVREEGEVFQGPAYTLATGAGDCDDHARLVMTIALAGGLPALGAFLYHEGGEPTHALAALVVNGRPAFAETTVDAAFGEAPLDAAKRLGVIHEREDLSQQVRLMSENDVDSMKGVTATVLTASLSDAFLAALGAWATTLQAKGARVNGLDFLQVWQAESGISSSALNPDGNHAGLNQMGAAERAAVGFTGDVNAWRQLSPEDQLPFVERFYETNIATLAHGDWSVLTNAGALYLLNFLPAFIGHAKDPSFVLALRSHDTNGWYRGNPSLDVGGKGWIEVGDMDKAIRIATGGVHAAKFAELAARMSALGDAPALDAPMSAGAAVAVIVGASVIGGLVAHWFGA